MGWSGFSHVTDLIPATCEQVILVRCTVAFTHFQPLEVSWA